jgi:hypothetical protein
MQEIAQLVIAYIQQRPLAVLGTALATGFAANKTVAYHSNSNFIFHLLVGLAGFFLSQVALLGFGFAHYLDALVEFRFFLDLIAAYLGSFVIAAVVNFLKPL